MISIIVAVYNAEKTLSKCIDSILSQSFHDIEMILVDDGSLDKSGEICDEYALKDSRVKVMHQENGGVSVARQTGLDAATGEYIIHVDTDDWIEEKEIEDLYTVAKKQNADIILCDYWTEEKHGSFYQEQQPQDYSSKTLRIQIINGTLHGSCWNKLVKRKCIYDNGVSFRPKHIQYCEDLLFWCRLLQNKDLKIGYIPKAYYHYNMRNDNSITHKSTPKLLNSEYSVIKEIEGILDKEEYIHLFNLKKNLLFNALLLKRFDILEKEYDDIKPQIIQQGKRYSPYTPISSCLSLALRGYPHLAYYCYKINILLIYCVNIIKKPFLRYKRK